VLWTGCGGGEQFRAVNRSGDALMGAATFGSALVQGSAGSTTLTLEPGATTSLLVSWVESVGEAAVEIEYENGVLPLE
jgi:hypothetical protein